MLKNYMEILVSDILNEIIGKYNVCNCNECINDIKSIALNNLPPKYFLSSQHEGERKAFLLDRQRRVSVLAKIAEAIELVSSRNKTNPCKR